VVEKERAHKDGRGHEKYIFNLKRREYYLSAEFTVRAGGIISGEAKRREEGSYRDNAMVSGTKRSLSQIIK